MPKFAVLLKEENFRVKREIRRWFFWKEILWEDAGFYTTRFLEKENANIAIETAKESLMKELESDGRTTKSSYIELEEIREDAEAFDEFAPGSGFSFFTSNDEVDNNEQEEEPVIYLLKK